MSVFAGEWWGHNQNVSVGEWRGNVNSREFSAKKFGCSLLEVQPYLKKLEIKAFCLYFLLLFFSWKRILKVVYEVGVGGWGSGGKDQYRKKVQERGGASSLAVHYTQFLLWQFTNLKNVHIFLAHITWVLSFRWLSNTWMSTSKCVKFYFYC